MVTVADLARYRLEDDYEGSPVAFDALFCVSQSHSTLEKT